jgi:hypothetical protein
MTKEVKLKLSLDQPATCQIKLPGELYESWSDWDARMSIAVEREADGEYLPVTTLTGTVDQAALHSLLRRLSSPRCDPIRPGQTEGPQSQPGGFCQ